MKIILTEYQFKRILLKEEMSNNISDQDKIIDIKKLLKSKEYLPSSYHEKIDELIRELLDKIN